MAAAPVTYNPSRDKVRALSAARNSMSPSITSLTQRTALGSRARNNAASTPSPSADATWLGPKPALVSQFELLPKKMDELLRVADRVIEAIPTMGPRRTAKRRYSCTRDSLRCEKNQALITSASGPDKLKLIWSRASAG